MTNVKKIKNSIKAINALCRNIQALASVEVTDNGLGISTMDRICFESMSVVHGRASKIIDDLKIMQSVIDTGIADCDEIRAARDIPSFFDGSPPPPQRKGGDTMRYTN